MRSNTSIKVVLWTSITITQHLTLWVFLIKNGKKYFVLKNVPCKDVIESNLMLNSTCTSNHKVEMPDKIDYNYQFFVALFYWFVYHPIHILKNYLRSCSWISFFCDIFFIFYFEKCLLWCVTVKKRDTRMKRKFSLTLLNSFILSTSIHFIFIYNLTTMIYYIQRDLLVVSNSKRNWCDHLDSR